MEDEIRILMLHGVLHLMGMDHETRPGGRWRARNPPGARSWGCRRPDRAGARMIFALLAVTVLAIVLLALPASVQLLYLESLRLRTRDLPSLEFFKSTLEDKIGLETEQGALSFLADQARDAGRTGGAGAGRMFLIAPADLADVSGSLLHRLCC